MSTESDDQSDVFATGWRTNSVRSLDVQTVQRNGREYLQFPLVPLTEMVLDYPENGTREYLPSEHIRETAGLWDGTLLTYVHPKNRNKTVRDPEEFMGSVIGAFHDPQALDGGEKLQGNGLIDVEKAKALGGSAAELVELLQNGEEVSVSAGYATADDEFRGGRFEGEAYDLVQGPPLPDHIAIFPSDSQMRARCSPADGCVAPKANAKRTDAEATTPDTTTETETMSESTIAEQRQAVQEMQQEVADLQAMVKDLLDSNDQPTACECGGDHAADAHQDQNQRANMAAVPGGMTRDLDSDRGRQREDPSEYPAGGRKAWERRQVGLDDVEEDDDLPPPGGRSAWEARNQRARTNAEQAAGETPPSAGARRSLSSRQNASGVEPAEWVAAEYPLTAMRHAQEREEQRQRWEQLKEQARRTDTNTTAARNRRNGS